MFKDLRLLFTTLVRYSYLAPTAGLILDLLRENFCSGSETQMVGSRSLAEESLAEADYWKDYFIISESNELSLTATIISEI